MHTVHTDNRHVYGDGWLSRRVWLRGWNPYLSVSLSTSRLEKLLITISRISSRSVSTFRSFLSRFPFSFLNHATRISINIFSFSFQKNIHFIIRKKKKLGKVIELCKQRIDDRQVCNFEAAPIGEKKKKERKLLVVAGNRFDKSGPVISRGKTRRDAGRNGEGGGRKKYTVTGPYQGLNCTVSRIRRGITVSHERRGTKSGRQDSLEESVPRRTLSPPPSTSAKCTHRGGLDCRCIMHSNLWSESSRAWSSLFPATLLLLSSSFIFPPSPSASAFADPSPFAFVLPSFNPHPFEMLTVSFFVSSSQIDDSILARKYFILKHDSIQRWSLINKLSFH